MSSEAREVRFDPTLGAWIVSRHADVLALLRDARVAVPGSSQEMSDGTASREPSPHDVLRDSALDALSPAMLERWRDALTADAKACVAGLASNERIDLVRDYAAPWSRRLAVRATGLAPAQAHVAAALARIVFLGAANATGAVPTAEVQEATMSLSRLLRSGAHQSSAHADVQTFVALSETLPGLLASCWLALLEHPAQMAVLRERRDLTSQAVHELLRFTSPSRAVFREVAVAFEMDGEQLNAGDRLVLQLHAANHDPAHFDDPFRLDIGRDASGQVAMGAGTHRCVGNALVRLAVRLATEALLERDDALELAGQADWVGGYAIRVVSTLPAMFVTHYRTMV